MTSEANWSKVCIVCESVSLRVRAIYCVFKVSILIATLYLPRPPPGGDMYLHKTSLLFESNPNPSWGWSNRAHTRTKNTNKLFFHALCQKKINKILISLPQHHLSQWTCNKCINVAVNGDPNDMWVQAEVGGKGWQAAGVKQNPPLLTRGHGSAFARVHPYVMCTCRASLTACGTQCVGNRKHQHEGEKRSG